MSPSEHSTPVFAGDHIHPTMALPDPRRIVVAYDTTTGAPIIADELIPAAPEGPLRSASVQTSFVGNPNEGLRGKDEKPDLGFIRRGGVTASFLAEQEDPQSSRRDVF